MTIITVIPIANTPLQILSFMEKSRRRITNQKMILQKYAEEHRFLNTQFYIDDGFSGADFNRPSFKRMMNDVESGKVGIVIVKDQSRLDRGTSRKIRAVQRAKGERGERVGTTVPYGYMKSPDDPRQYIPDPETAPVIKRIFEMYASGIGIVKICDRLSAENILSPSAYAFRKTGSRSGKAAQEQPFRSTEQR